MTVTLTTLDLNTFQNRTNNLVDDDDENDANRSSKINFELNKQELDEFISTLEVIQAVIIKIYFSICYFYFNY